MKAQAFIIHLARAEGRRSQAEKLAQTLPIPAEMLDAVDGLLLTDAEIEAAYRPDLHCPRYPFALRRQEIGCFLSHRKAWRAIVERELDFGLIVEDDVEVDLAKLNELLALAVHSSAPGDYLRFPKKTVREEGRELASAGGVSIAVSHLPGLGMQLQLVGRAAAQSLLDATEQFDRPVDTMIQMRWLHAARVLAAWPICVRELSASLGGSTIQKKSKPLAEVLSREVKRSLYRLAVRMENSRKRVPAPTA